MSECLTREILQEAFNRLVNQRLDAFAPPAIYCHPIDAPFLKAIFDAKLPPSAEKRVWRLWNECKRKYLIGGKLGIDKWQLRPLVAQYEAKLANL